MEKRVNILVNPSGEQPREKESFPVILVKAVWETFSSLDLFTKLFIIIAICSIIFVAYRAFNPLLETRSRASGNILNINNYGSLQKAIDAAGPGDSVYIPTGTWTGTAKISGKSNLTIYGDGPTSIITAPGQTEVLGIYSSSLINLRDFAILGDYTVKGQRGLGIFSLKGLNVDRINIKDTGFSGVFSNGLLYNANFRDIRVEHSGDFGIDAQALNNADDNVNNPQDILIENSYFSGFESKNYPAHAIYLSHTLRATVRGNQIYEVRNPNPAHNASAITLSRTAVDSLIENNTIKQSCFGLQVAGGETVGTYNSTIRNNVFDNLERSAIQFWENSDNTVIDRNTLTNTQANSAISWGGTKSPTNIHILNNFASNNVGGPLGQFPVGSIVELANNSWQPGYVSVTSTSTPTQTPTLTLTPTPTSQPIDIIFTSPSDGAMVLSKTRITLTTATSSNVKQVSFIVNNSLACTDTSAPFTCQWRVPNKSGNYTLTATARDTYGNSKSTSIRVYSK